MLGMSVRRCLGNPAGYGILCAGEMTLSSSQLLRSKAGRRIRVSPAPPRGQVRITPVSHARLYGFYDQLLSRNLCCYRRSNIDPLPSESNSPSG